MRTTIRLDESLLKEAKKIAAESGRTLTSVIEEALRLSFAMRRESLARKAVKLRTFKGNGVQAGVDLDHSSVLLDLMETDAAAGR